MNTLNSRFQLWDFGFGLFRLERPGRRVTAFGFGVEGLGVGVTGLGSRVVLSSSTTGPQKVQTF